MKFILTFLILFSAPLMANKIQGKHYLLTEQESATKWRYFYRVNLSSGFSSNKLQLEKCYNMNIDTGEKIEIPCSDLDKLKPTLDLREIGETQKSASAI